MDHLICLVRICLTAKTLEERERAADELVSEVTPSLGRYIRSRRPKDTEEDVLQETLSGIFEGLRDFEGDNDKTLWSWCYQIARNKIIDTFQGRKVTLSTFVDPELLREALNDYQDSGVLSGADRADLNYALDLIKKSDPPCIQLLWDRYYVGLTFRAMAEELGITEAAATMRVKRCLALAQKLMTDKV